MMGGCRCTFRNCGKNTANSPGLHFFHYPLKHEDRLKLWIKYSLNDIIRKLPQSQAKNKVVCSTHFRDECFMNYKKDRLVHQAIPTLTRLPNGMVLDYEESEYPEPKILEPTSKKHLIPPQTVLSSNQGNSDSNCVETFVIETLEEYTNSSERPNLTKKPESPSISVKRSNPVKINDLHPAKITKISNPRILNPGVRQMKIESTQTPPPPPEADDSQISIVLCDEVPIVCETPQIIETYDDFGVMNDIEKDDEKGEQDLVPQSLLSETIRTYERQIQDLKDQLAKMEEIQKSNTQVQTVSTSRAPNITDQPVQVKKSQLFNSIKKYLSQSMASLLRMEMFGRPERPWKPDEQQVSVEILRLGDSVFDFFRDEWRFRLPPKTDVEQWLSSSHSVDDEEEP